MIENSSEIILIYIVMGDILGTWWHAGFHLTTAIMGPTVLTLPYALRGMGWWLGLASLTVVAAVTFYAYLLMSRVLDHCEGHGRRHIRFRELAADVLGMHILCPLLNLHLKLLDRNR